MRRYTMDEVAEQLRNRKSALLLFVPKSVAVICLSLSRSRNVNTSILLLYLVDNVVVINE